MLLPDELFLACGLCSVGHVKKKAARPSVEAARGNFLMREVPSTRRRSRKWKRLELNQVFACRASTAGRAETKESARSSATGARAHLGPACEAGVGGADSVWARRDGACKTWKV